MDDQLRNALKRAESHDRRIQEARERAIQAAQEQYRQQQLAQAQAEEIATQETRKDVFFIGDKSYPQNVSYNGSEIRMTRVRTSLGDDLFRAVIDGKYQTRDAFSHPEGARQEAEFAVRLMHDAIIWCDTVRQDLLDALGNDEVAVRKILKDYVNNAIGSRVEKL